MLQPPGAVSARLPVHRAAAWGGACQHWSSLQLLLAFSELGELQLFGGFFWFSFFFF